MEARVITNSTALAEIVRLLRASNLPHKDIVLGDNLFFSYHDQHGTLIGSAGLEFYSKFALIRSIAVPETHRNKSIGREIVKHMISKAKEKAILEVYLLTETAHDFFLKNGFQDIARDLVPSEIKESGEFSSVCPASASVMYIKII